MVSKYCLLQILIEGEGIYEHSYGMVTGHNTILTTQWLLYMTTIDSSDVWRREISELPALVQGPNYSQLKNAFHMLPSRGKVGTTLTNMTCTQKE